ncbi:MAG: hypothetical protein ISS26_06750 [Candidatus Omnitrophica bacterium]|nr:hypothetical protein [Candidatus Omnitrophota bacterium]
MNGRRLLKRRKKTLGNMSKPEECIRGSLVIMSRFCGKPNCRCLRGQKHKAVYLSQSYRGKTRMIYIPQAQVKKAAGHIKSYRKVKGVLNILSDINIKLLTGK